MNICAELHGDMQMCRIKSPRDNKLGALKAMENSISNLGETLEKPEIRSLEAATAAFSTIGDSFGASFRTLEAVASPLAGASLLATGCLDALNNDILGGSLLPARVAMRALNRVNSSNAPRG